MRGDATPARATFTLAVFFCINLLNYSDRQAVSAVLPLLLDGKSNELGADVSSTQGGMLTTAFIIVYMCVSPVFGYLADRAPSRKLLVMVGLTLWAIASGLSSFAPSYATLLAARAAVGIGEASYNTVAPVIISDMYPPAERTAKLAVFYIAIPLGSAMGFMIGGQVGDMLGWRWALRVTPALLVLLTVFAVPLVHDPERGASEGAGKGPVQGEAGSGIRGWWRDVTSVLSVPSMAFSIIGQAGCNFAIGAITVWIPTTVTMIEGGPSVVAARGGISPTLVFGAITVVSGLTGTICGSLLSNKLGTVLQNWGAEALVCAIAMIFAAPLILGALVAIPEPYMGPTSLIPFWVLVLLGEVSLCLYWAPIAAFMMLVVTPRRRATAQGLGLLASHLLGDAASPVLIGMVVDWLKSSHGCDITHTQHNTSHVGNASHGLDTTPCAHNSTVCEWKNATVGASSGCIVSNSAQVSAYQVGLYLTLPAMALAGALFLAAARWQPADHKAMLAMMAQSQSSDGSVRDPMLQSAKSMHSGVTPRGSVNETGSGSRSGYYEIKA